jgi:hypothetical protein
MIYFKSLLFEVVWERFERCIVTIFRKSMVHVMVVCVFEVHVTGSFKFLNFFVVVRDDVLMGCRLRTTDFTTVFKFNVFIKYIKLKEYINRTYKIKKFMNFLK